MSSVTTTVTELPESRVRVQAEVAPEEVERSVAQAAKRLGGSLRIPGFRQGKVPPPVIIQQIGREAVLDEAVRDAIGRWYAEAVEDSRIVPVGEPELDMGDLPGRGAPLRFAFEIGVRPKAQLGDYKGIEAPRREVDVDDERIAEEIDRLRERSAKTESVDRPAAMGDLVVMDFVGTLDGTPFEGGTARDQLVELGAGRLIPGFEDQLQGAAAGEERTVQVAFPADYGAEHLAGRPAEFAVTVKDVKERRLPELDEDFAIEQGFDTVDELRDDVREKLAHAEEHAVENEYREAVLDTVVANASVGVPEALVEARARELLDQMLHQLSHQGISREMYFQISGRTEEQVIAEGRDDADKALRREAVLAAIAEAEGISPTDEEILEHLGPAAQGQKPQKVLERLRRSGQLDVVREDLAQRKALDLLVEQATPTPAPAASAAAADEG
jgi:trigger factor